MVRDAADVEGNERWVAVFWKRRKCLLKGRYQRKVVLDAAGSVAPIFLPSLSRASHTQHYSIKGLTAHSLLAMLFSRATLLRRWLRRRLMLLGLIFSLHLLVLGGLEHLDHADRDIDTHITLEILPSDDNVRR